MKGFLLFFVLGTLLGPAALASSVLNISSGGDLNFNRDQIPPDRSATYHKGRWHQWDTMTAVLKTVFKEGDLNFVNMEGVVSDEARSPASKRWKFMSHPNSLQHMIDFGINLISVANNHSYDYRSAGLRDTQSNMEFLASRNHGVHWHGVGNYSDVTKPTEFEFNGVRVAFSAIGIGAGSQYHSTSSQIGTLNYRVASHYNAVLEGLKSSRAEFKILSIHQGAEKETGLPSSERSRFRRAVDEAGVNLVLGHHPHVVRPIEIYRDSVIAYSLGNLLLVGAANIDGRALGKDYGLVLKTQFAWNSNKRKYTPSMIEAVPLKGVHMRPKKVNAKKYGASLNRLIRRYFSGGIQFTNSGGRLLYYP